MYTQFIEVEEELRKQEQEKRIEKNFSYHRAGPNQAETYEKIRGTARAYAHQLSEQCPESQELDKAIEKLEEVVFWANAAVARNTKAEPEETPMITANHIKPTGKSIIASMGAPVKQQESPTETRKGIVQDAIDDLEALKDREGYYDVFGPYGPWSCNAEFIVDRNKRTVVALLRGYESKQVRARGIAKADPSDVFNAHIGKAIALRRALNKQVPSVYLISPQPENVEIGDVVEHNGGKRYTIVETKPFQYPKVNEAQLGSPISRLGKLIEDTNRKLNEGGA
jgi:hypothetical protein